MPSGAQDEADIADRIYEAAFVTERWPGVLEAASSISNSASGAIFAFDDSGLVRAVSEPNVQALLDELMAEGNWQRSDCVQRMLSLRPLSFVRVDDFMTAEEIARDPVRIRSSAFGIGSHICSSVVMPSGEIVLFVFQRWHRDGIYDQPVIGRLDGLRPHLARASLIASRLRLEQARNTVQALRQIGLPAAVLRASGQVLAHNDLLEDLSEVFLPTAGGGMALADASANALLQQAIARNEDNGVVRSIAVPAAKSRPALIVHLLPLRRDAHDIFSGGDILVAATAVSASALVPSPSILSGLFDLSPAEARLAAALATGRSLGEVANESGIAVKSARTYLDRIFQKTGTNRQGQLVALLKSTHPFG